MLSRSVSADKMLYAVWGVLCALVAGLMALLSDFCGFGQKNREKPKNFLDFLCWYEKMCYLCIAIKGCDLTGV